MNQSIIFNDDLIFNEQEDAWAFTAQLAGETVSIYFHSMQLKQIAVIDNSTKFDLEEVIELWLERNEIEGNAIHIQMK